MQKPAQLREAQDHPPVADAERGPALGRVVEGFVLERRVGLGERDGVRSQRVAEVGAPALVLQLQPGPTPPRA